MNELSPAQFLTACGASSPLQLEVENLDNHEKVSKTLSLPFALIGRDERAELSLNDARISLRHAYLQMVAGHLWCIDLGSRTGLHWEQGVQPLGSLGPNQSIHVGPFAIRLLGVGVNRELQQPQGPNPLSAVAFDPSSSLPVELEFIRGTAQPSRWQVNRVLTLVGRSHHCKVRLRSSAVSRVHCALLHTPEGQLWVIDLLGRGGTRVNGASLRWAPLEDGDKLQIGQFLIRVHARVPVLSSTLAVHVLENSATPPGTEISPAAPRAALLFPPPVPNGSDLTGNSSLLPLVTQLSLMQQQMFDQFQQALTMMVQMFSGLHRDQMELIRQELSELHELTRELRDLQAELAKHPKPQLTETPSHPSADPAVIVPGELAFILETANERSELKTPPQAPVEVTGSKEETTKAASLEIPASPESMAATPPASVRSGAEVHAWLTHRLANLQQQRQSRWQKIFAFLTSKRSEETGS